MFVILSIVILFLLYVIRFKKDFDEEQVNTFVSACIVMIFLFGVSIWLMNR